MAPTSRTRAGRPLRRTRNGGDSTSSAPLQPIGEDSVVELPKPLSVTSTGTHFSDSPEKKPLVKTSKRKNRDARDLSEETIEKKKQKALALLDELQADGVSRVDSV